MGAPEPPPPGGRSQCEKAEGLWSTWPGDARRVQKVMQAISAGFALLSPGRPVWRVSSSFQSMESLLSTQIFKSLASISGVGVKDWLMTSATPAGVQDVVRDTVNHICIAGQVDSLQVAQAERQAV